MYFFIPTVLLIIVAQLPVHADDCETWFAKLKIKPGKECFLKCASSSTDFSTFGCENECARLCKSGVTTEFLFNVSDLYPGLTKEERGLAASEPKKTWRAYQLSWTAEHLCQKIYKYSRTNDESDACRHFVWATLLQIEFGTGFSTQILNAHEDDPKQPIQEKSMDLANNRLGQIVGVGLQKNGKTKPDDILQAFKDNLARDRLIVLKKRSVKTGELK